MLLIFTTYICATLIYILQVGDHFFMVVRSMMMISGVGLLTGVQKARIEKNKEDSRQIGEVMPI